MTCQSTSGADIPSSMACTKLDLRFDPRKVHSSQLAKDKRKMERIKEEKFY